MNKIDRFFYRHSIRNLSLYMVICYAFGYILYAINPLFLSMLTLNPERILHGQIWRLVTWVLVPPDTSNIFFVLIACLFYYSIGTSLERTWGTAQYNKYIFSGLLFTMAGAFLAAALAVPINGMTFAEAGSYTSVFFTTNYVLLSVFLAYAATFPDAVVLLFFIIPMKVKWLGVIYAIFLIIDVISYAASPYFVFGVIAIVASLLNFLIFFLHGRNFQRWKPSEVKRRKDFQKSVHKGQQQAQSASRPAGNNRAVKMTPYRHKCAICGRTEITNPELEFRYCSKCEGNYEFCSDHLFSHVHAVGGSAPYIIPQQNNGGSSNGQQ